MNKEYEQASAVGQVLFWSAPRKTYLKTKGSKLSAMNIYGDVTVRNSNTAKYLAKRKL